MTYCSLVSQKEGGFEVMAKDRPKGNGFVFRNAGEANDLKDAEAKYGCDLKISKELHRNVKRYKIGKNEAVKLGLPGPMPAHLAKKVLTAPAKDVKRPRT